MRRLAAGAHALAALLLLAALPSPESRLAAPAGSPPLPGRAGNGAAPRPPDPPGLEVLAPLAVKARRPFLLEVSGAAAQGEVPVRIDGAPGGLEAVSNAAERRALRGSLSAEGWHRIEAGEPLGSPTTTWVRVDPAPLVSWLGPAGPLRDALAEAGYRVADTLEPGADLAVLVGPPPDRTALERFARGGGGLLAFGEGAARALGPLSWFPFEPLPPAEPPPAPPPPGAPAPDRPPVPSGSPPDVPTPPEKRREESASVLLVLVLDRSGSMEGSKLERAKQAAVATAETLDPEDRVAVVAFGEEALETFPLGRAGDRDAIRARVSGLRAGGGTRFEPALRLAFGIARSGSAGIRHVVLLSDGMTEDWATADYPGLVAEARGKGVTLSTVGLFGPGERGDEALALLARWGKGRFYPVEDPREIPQVFTLEARRVAGAGRRDGAGARPQEPPCPDAGDSPAATGPAPAPERSPEVRAVAGDPHEATAGLDFASAPALQTHLRGSARPLASVPIRTEPGGEPLLVLRPLGGGWVCAWCAEGGDASPWIASGHLPSLALALAEFARRPDRGGVAWRLEAFGAFGRIAVTPGEEGRIPEELREGRRIDAWTRILRLDPSLEGSAGADPSGRLRSSLRRSARALATPGPTGPASPAPAQPGGGEPARGGRSGLLFAVAALAIALGEVARRLPSGRQRRSPFPSRRGGDSAAGGPSFAGSR